MGTGLRICSLLPSATEIVFALGLGDRLVAVTHECDYPLEATRLPVITRSTLDHGMRHSREIHHHIASALHAGSSIYALDHALLERLDPTLILTQELCDVCAVSYDIVQQAVHRLRGTRTILSLEPTSLGEILRTIQQVGDAADVAETVIVIATYPGSATRDSLVRRDGWDRLTAVKSGRVWELPAGMVKRPGPGVLEGLERLAEILAP